MEKKYIVCFTASYPYGEKETYFENELKYLSKSYSKVYLIPTYNPFDSYVKRDVPENVIVFDPVLKNNFGRVFQSLKCFKFSSLFIKDLIIHNVLFNRKKIKEWLNAYFDYLCSLDFFLSQNFDNNTTILYSYWASKTLFVSTHLKKYKKIMRMHGGDFYLNRNGGYLTLRKELYEKCDLLLPISNNIRSILIDFYKIDSAKIFLSYLGVNNYSKSSVINNSGTTRFVSCSNVYPLKRVELILDLLNEFDFFVEWHHFGDGQSFWQLEDYVSKNAMKNVKVILHGHLSQNEMHEIYQTLYFDWFINTSKYEGLPVSIMEANSYGIPAIATDVGGTSEIVNLENGLLIPENFDKAEVARLISNISKEEYLKIRMSAYNTWYSQFNGEVNYSNLLNVLKKTAYENH